MADGLKIVVGGDIAPAQKALKDLVSAAGEAGSKAGAALEKGLDDSSSLVDRLKKSFKDLKDKGLINLAGIEDAMKQFKQAVKLATSPDDIFKLNKAIEFLGKEQDKLKTTGLEHGLDDINRSAQRTANSALGLAKVFDLFPPEISHITHQFDGLLQSYEQIRSKSSSTGSAVKSLATSFAIPLGIGAALSVGVLLVEKFAENLFQTGDAADEATQKVRELIKASGDISREAAAGTAGEAANVNALVAIVRDQTKSYQERNNALNELKKINKSYFGDLTLEASQLGLLTQRANEYSKAIVQQAVIKSFSEEIGKIAIAIAQQSKEVGKATSELDKFEKKVKQANATIVKGVPQPFSVQGTSLFDPNVSGLIDANKNLRKQEGLLRDLGTQYTDLTNSINSAVEESLKLRPLDVDTTKGKDAIDELIKRAQKLAAFLTKTTQREFRFEINPEDTKQQTFEKAKKFIGDALDPLKRFDFKIKTSIQTEIDKDIRAKLDKIASAVQKTIKIPEIKLPVSVGQLSDKPIDIKFFTRTELLTNDFLKPVQDAFKNTPLEIQTIPRLELANIDLLRGFNDAFEKAGIKFTVPVNFDLQGDVTANAEKLFTQFRQALALDRLESQLNDIVTNFAASAASSVGTAIGNVISGRSSGLESLFQILSSAMKQFGEALIAFGVSASALKNLIKNPTTAIIAGIGLVALSQVVANFKPKGLAAGGLATGPTLALVGEGRNTSLNNPEVIAPLDKLKGLLSGLVGDSGTVRVIVDGKLRGQDMALQTSRTSRSQRRLGA